MYLPLVMQAGPPLLDDMRRSHGQREIDDGQEPESAPILRHFGEVRTQLVDANDAVDREVDREDVTGDERRLGDSFARTGESREEELRTAGGGDDGVRGLRPE